MMTTDMQVLPDLAVKCFELCFSVHWWMANSGILAPPLPSVDKKTRSPGHNKKPCVDNPFPSQEMYKKTHTERTSPGGCPNLGGGGGTLPRIAFSPILLITINCHPWPILYSIQCLCHP